MDWSGCDLVEVIEGKVSGLPLVKGTRVPADVIVSNFLSGSPVEEVAENYPSVTRATIELLLEFAGIPQMRYAS
jgi:uncharacterized protein (DUF433 family)